MNQSAVYMALFNQNFHAHDALARGCESFTSNIFASRLNFSTRDLLNNSKPITFNEAYDASRGELGEYKSTNILRGQMFAHSV